MKTHILLISLLVSVCLARADMIAMSHQEQELREKFNTYPKPEEVVAAFNSQHYLLHQEAIKWMILHRDTKTWNSIKDQKSKLKETSLLLYPILDFMVAQPIDEKRPLILALGDNYLRLLSKKEEELPPRNEYSYIDPPVDESLYKLLVEDLERVQSSRNDTIEAARLLLRYRAPSEQLESLVEAKAMIDKSDVKQKKDHRLLAPAVEVQVGHLKDNDLSPTATPETLTNSWIYGRSTIVILFALFGIVVFWRLSKKTR